MVIKDTKSEGLDPEIVVMRHSLLDDEGRVNPRIGVGYIFRTRGNLPEYQRSVPMFTVEEVVFFVEGEEQPHSARKIFDIDEDRAIKLASRTVLFSASCGSRDVEVNFLTDERSILTLAHEAGHGWAIANLGVEAIQMVKMRVMLESAGRRLIEGKEPFFGDIRTDNDLRRYLRYAIGDEQLAWLYADSRISEVAAARLPLITGEVTEKVAEARQQSLSSYSRAMANLCQRLGIEFTTPLFDSIEEGIRQQKALSEEIKTTSKESS